MHHLAGILITVASLATLFGIVYIAVTASHRLKMAMVERGLNPNQTKDTLTETCVYLFLPIGLIIGFFFQEAYPKMEGPFPYLIFGFLFVGIGRIVAYFIKKNRQNKDNNTNTLVEL